MALSESRRKKFEKRYSNDLPGLHLAAANAIFNLNRYTKHASCSNGNQLEIYKLKNNFIRLLYSADYCESVYHHEKNLQPKLCFGCDGTGKASVQQACEKCYGTGEYHAAKTLIFVVFRFLVGKQHFCWHQPKEIVDFQYQTTESSSVMTDVEAKPVDIPRHKMKEAKELVQFAIDVSFNNS